MQRERLTPERIRRFTCPPDKLQAFLWDTEAPRLAVRATRGAKSFVFEGKLNRRTIRRTIGDVRTWNLDDARAEARRLQTLVDQGADPREVDRQREDEKAAARAAEEAARIAAERAQMPATGAWKAYIESRRPKWGELSFRDHERVSQEGGETIKRGRKTSEDGTTQPGALRTLLLLPLAQIDADRVRDWLAAERPKRPTHAALAFRLLRGFLNWCADHPEYADLVSSQACAARKVREELPKRRVKNDCLQREQLGPWFASVCKIPNPVISAYLQIVLLTGARREELAALRWEDVGFQWKTLRIADKVEGERTIPLTPHVAALLHDLKARNETPPKKPRRLRMTQEEFEAQWRPSPWVFSSRTAKSGRLQEPGIQHARACAAAGIEGLTIHGLRRSLATLSEWVESPAGVVAQIQGHKPSATRERHYIRRPIDLLRLWHTKIEGWILGQAGIDQPGTEQAPELRLVANGDNN